MPAAFFLAKTLLEEGGHEQLPVVEYACGEHTSHKVEVALAQ